MLVNGFAHAGHTEPLVFFGHFERLMNGVGKLLDIVRIDEERVGKFIGGAGKGAEDKSAAFIVTRSDEFLGYQVHAVMQGSDETDRGGAVVAEDFLVGVMPLQKHDRFPMRGGETGVDAVGFGGDFLEKLLVTGDVRAAGSGNLHEGKAPLEGGIEFEKELDGVETFEDTLGVVNAIHADAEAGRLRRPVRRRERRVLRQSFENREGENHWEKKRR